MVTVEVDPVRVESRLAAGQIGCPGCGGVLGGWGYGRARTIAGLADPVRPRRARCRACAVTHVLLPATMLFRRAYAAEWVWASLRARARGWGRRRIGAEFLVPAATVRGWLRRAAKLLEPIRVWFVQLAVTAGVDVMIPDGSGCPWRDVLAAVELATTVIRRRFGPVGLVGEVTPPRVAVVASGGRLRAPGWPGPQFRTPVWQMPFDPHRRDLRPCSCRDKTGQHRNYRRARERTVKPRAETDHRRGDRPSG